MTPSAELYPSMLFRAAGGERSIEAAIILLAETNLLSPLHHCITLDTDQGRAWLDWCAVAEHAQRLTADQRAVVLTAAALATEVRIANESEHRAIGLAFNHLLS